MVKMFMFYVGSERNLHKLIKKKKKVQQELLNTHATFGLRNCGAELIPDGWDALLEKYCREPALFLDIHQWQRQPELSDIPCYCWSYKKHPKSYLPVKGII